MSADGFSGIRREYPDEAERASDCVPVSSITYKGEVLRLHADLYALRTALVEIAPNVEHVFAAYDRECVKPQHVWRKKPAHSAACIALSRALREAAGIIKASKETKS